MPVIPDPASTPADQPTLPKEFSTRELIVRMDTKLDKLSRLDELVELGKLQAAAQERQAIATEKLASSHTADVGSNEEVDKAKIGARVEIVKAITGVFKTRAGQLMVVIGIIIALGVTGLSIQHKSLKLGAMSTANAQSVDEDSEEGDTLGELLEDSE